jgi:hypothetical protein
MDLRPIKTGNHLISGSKDLIFDDAGALVTASA